MINYALEEIVLILFTVAAKSVYKKTTVRMQSYIIALWKLYFITTLGFRRNAVV